MAPDISARPSAIAPVVTFERELYGSTIQDDAVLLGRDFAAAPATALLAPGTVGLSYEEAGRLDEADVLFMTFVGPDDRSALNRTRSSAGSR
jgi:iron complex transport system substrate-binding protein